MQTLLHFGVPVLVAVIGVIIITLQNRKPRRTSYEKFFTMNRAFNVLYAEIEACNNLSWLDDLDDDIFNFGQLFQYNTPEVGRLIIELTDVLNRKRVQLTKIKK